MDKLGGNYMKKFMTVALLAAMVSMSAPAAFAGTHGVDRQVTGKSIAGGLASLIIWPGIGQMVKVKKQTKLLHTLCRV